MKNIFTNMATAVLVISSLGWSVDLTYAQNDGKAPAVQEDTGAKVAIKAAKLGSTRNLHQCENLFFAGQFAKDDIPTLGDNKITRVVSLRTEGEMDWDEQTALADAGIEMVNFPIGSPDALTDEVFDKVRGLLCETETKTQFHCGSANRVGCVWLTYRVLDEGVDEEAALAEAKKIGARNPEMQAKALAYIKQQKAKKQEDPKQEESVKPGVNKSFVDPELDSKPPADAIDATSQWNAFRGSGNSVSAAKNLPTVWNDSKNIAWTLDLPGYGQSSPVIWGDKVFTTTMQGAEKETPTIICASLESGKLLWQQELTSTQKIKASDYVTRSSPTSAVDATALYSFFESGELIATNHSGEILWQRSLVADYGEYQGSHGIGSSLAMNDEYVFVLAAHEGPSYLLAVDKITGKNAWKTDLASKVGWSSPTVAGDVLLLSVSGTVQGFETKTGHRVWSIDGVSGNTVASPTVNGNVAYVGSSERAQNFAIEFDASGKSNSTSEVWKSDEVTSSFGSPLYHDGQLYYVNRQGTAYSVDSETGKTTWKGRISGSCWASPIAADGKIYFFTKDGATDVYSAGAEPDLIGTNELTVKDRIYGVAVAESRFVVRTGTRLVCISKPLPQLRPQ